MLEYLHLGIPKQTRCDAQEFAGNTNQAEHHPFYSCRLAGYIHHHTPDGMKDCCSLNSRNSIVPGAFNPSGHDGTPDSYLSLVTNGEHWARSVRNDFMGRRCWKM